MLIGKMLTGLKLVGLLSKYVVYVGVWLLGFVTLFVGGVGLYAATAGAGGAPLLPQSMLVGSNLGVMGPTVGNALVVLIGVTVLWIAVAARKL